MKTFKTVMVTLMVTVMVAMVGFGYFVIEEGIVKVERVATEHSKIIYVDGELSSEETWDEILGYQINVDLVDGTYIEL